MIFDKTHILVDTNFKSQKELFEHLDKLALEKKLSQKPSLVFNSFLKRESEGTTGFEKGFSIPHARVEGISEPSLFVVRNKEKFSDWDSLDGNGVEYAIALMIPLKSGSLHIDVLSTIATQLLDEKFRDIISNGTKDQIFKKFKNIIKNINKDDEKEVISKSKNKELLVGISACPAGVAHTFMAKQKMEDSAKKMNMDIKWETQGANGQKNKILKEDIDRASLIIIASDIELDLSRFLNKNILITDTNDAIKNGEKLINRAKKDSSIYKGDNKKSENIFLNFLHLTKQSFQSSFNKPWIYLFITATLLAIISLIGFSKYGQNWSVSPSTLDTNLFKIQEISKFALYFSMPFTAASVAKKILNKGEVFALVFIACLLLNTPSYMSGYHAITGVSQKQVNIFYEWNGSFSIHQLNHGTNIIGAILVTFGTVLFVKYTSKFLAIFEKNNANKIIKILRYGTSPWISILVPSALVLFGIVFALGAPLSWLSSQISYGLIEYSRDYWWLRFIIGGTLGMFLAWDLGGTVNKIAIIILIGLAQRDLRFAAIIAVAIPTASIGYGTTYAFHKRKFKEEDAKDAKLSFKKGLNGITEGPLFLTNKYGLRVMLPNIISTFIVSGLTFIFGLYIFSGGPIGVLFMGAQADLAGQSDIGFINAILPRGEGLVTAICSLFYGILGYYLVMSVGALSYVSIASGTFAIPGKNKIFI